MTTFINSGQTLDDFAANVYVHCSNCQKCAQVLRIPFKDEVLLADDSVSSSSARFRSRFSSRKVSCLHCGYIRIWEWKFGRQPDWSFGLPLWLQTPCCSKNHWALNEEHLSFLERYVSAKHRIKFSVSGRIRNKTMASRLPT